MANMSAVFDYPHTVAAEDIDEPGRAGNYHYVKWMQHAGTRKNLIEKSFQLGP